MSPEDFTVDPTDDRSKTGRPTLGDDSGSTQSLTTRIVNRVAAEKGVDPLELRPLYEFVDPDALRRYLDSGGDSRRRAPVKRCTFHYETVAVTVFADGRIRVDQRDAEREPSHR